MPAGGARPGAGRKSGEAWWGKKGKPVAYTAKSKSFCRTIKNTMAFFDVSEMSIKKLIKEGKLKTVKIGSKNLVTEESIKEYCCSLRKEK